MPTNRPAIIGLRKSVGIKAMPAVFGQSFTSNPSSAKAVPIENTLISIRRGILSWMLLNELPYLFL